MAEHLEMWGLTEQESKHVHTFTLLKMGFALLIIAATPQIFLWGSGAFLPPPALLPMM